MKKFAKIYNKMHGIPDDEEETKGKKKKKKEKVTDPLDIDAIQKQLDDLEKLEKEL